MYTTRRNSLVWKTLLLLLLVFTQVYITNGTHSESLDDPMCPNQAQILPTNERQIRPLTKLEPSEQRQCWRQAVEEAGGKVPSGRQVKDIVDRIRERTKVPNPYREGEICILIPKDNPELRGKSGCWGAITHVGEYFCTIKTWESEYTVKIVTSIIHQWCRVSQRCIYQPRKNIFKPLDHIILL